MVPVLTAMPAAGIPPGDILDDSGCSHAMFYDSPQPVGSLPRSGFQIFSMKACPRKEHCKLSEPILCLVP
jgi:hypothetical protein